MRGSLSLGLGTLILSAAAAATGMTYRRYRKEMRELCAELAASSQLSETKVGPIEYGRHGHGRPVLAIHGAGGGFDQGLAIGDLLFSSGFQVIAPSRFGYLNTALPEKASPAAQADAHVALLDALGIDQAIVFGVSAGAPSAIETALRHPQRVAALILAVPRAFAPNGPIAPPEDSAAMLETVMAGADFAFWAAAKVARRQVVRFLGVDPDLEARATPAERAQVTEIIRHILPLSRRLAGLEHDSETRIHEWPLERIRTPTLIISAKDDGYRTLEAARYTAERISGAELMVLESGGHLMVGRGAEVRAGIQRFLERIPAPLAAAA